MKSKKTQGLNYLSRWLEMSFAKKLYVYQSIHPAPYPSIYSDIYIYNMYTCIYTCKPSVDGRNTAPIDRLFIP